MSSVNILDLGLKPYLEVLQLQEELFNKNIETKLNAQPTQNYLILCEHNPVFTLGKSGKRENILVSDEEMKVVDKLRGKTSRSAWLIDLIRREMKRKSRG